MVSDAKERDDWPIKITTVYSINYLIINTVRTKPLSEPGPSIVAQYHSNQQTINLYLYRFFLLFFAPRQQKQNITSNVEGGRTPPRSPPPSLTLSCSNQNFCIIHKKKVKANNQLSLERALHVRISKLEVNLD